MHLAFVACSHLVRWQLGRVECVGGQDETTGLVDEGLASGERGGQRAVDLGGHLVGASVWSRSTPCAIAGMGAHRTGGQRDGLQVPLEVRKGLRRIGFTGKGSAA
jgi:hypothetical protein